MSSIPTPFPWETDQHSIRGDICQPQGGGDSNNKTTGVLPRPQPRGAARGSDGSVCSRSSPSNGTFPVLSQQLCFPGSLSPTSKSMTRQSEPLTWRYKLPLIIPAARQALGALSGEPLCPLTPLHFSCFKGFSPHPSLNSPARWIPGPSKPPWHIWGLHGQNTGRGGARSWNSIIPLLVFIPSAQERLLIFIFSSQSIFNMELKHTPRRHL